MDPLRVALGAALAALGRSLFWLFVAAMGFALGLQLSTRLLAGSPQWLQLIIAIGAGSIGAIAAVLLQRVGIGLAGFLAGAFIGHGLLDLLSINGAAWTWIVYLAGGIVGAVLMSVVFDWALVVLSSFAGGVFVVRGIGLELPWSGVAFFLVLVGGIVLQSRSLDRGPTTPPAAR